MSVKILYSGLLSPCQMGRISIALLTLRVVDIDRQNLGRYSPQLIYLGFGLRKIVLTHIPSDYTFSISKLNLL